VMMMLLFVRLNSNPKNQFVDCREVKKGQQNDLAEIKPQVGKLKVGWNPVSTVEVKAQQNDAAEIRKGGKLNPNDFIKTGAEEPKPEKKGPLSMEELVKADMRDN
jgi:hypothetical protein